jgi:hypothetical protein
MSRLFGTSPTACESESRESDARISSMSETHHRSFYALLFFSAIFVMLIAGQLFSFRKVDDTTNPVWVVFGAFWLIPIGARGPSISLALLW